MRLFGALLFATLTSTMAFADEAKPADPPPAPPAEAAPAAETPAPAPTPVKAAKVPLRVVRVLPESHQALLFDKLKNTHVLADVGKTIDGYKVEDIDDDEVTLTAENGSQVVLAAPDPAWRRHRRDDVASNDEARPARPARTPKAKPAAANAMPEDPYAPAAAPQDPYDIAATMGDSAMTKDGIVRSVESPDALDEIRTVDAPKPIPGAGAVVTATAPKASASAAPTAGAATSAAAAPPATTNAAPATTVSPATAAVTAAATAPSTAAESAAASNSFFSSETTAGAPAPAAPAAAAPAGAKLEQTAVDGPTVLSRGEVNAALGNFGALASSIHGSFTPTGAKLDTVADGSLFAKAGLHSGDTITAVNGQPLRSIDDAANVYARASNAKLLTVQVQRAGKPMTLRVAIQ